MFILSAKLSFTLNFLQNQFLCRFLPINDAGMAERGGGRRTPQILYDHLTLCQPEGADYAHQLLSAPSNFHTFRHPCDEVLRKL